MITYEELFVLNRALDGKDMWHVRSFDNVKDKLNVISKAKRSLIEKGLLNNNSSFTKEGIKLVKCLEKYKNTKKYFNFQNVWAALTDDGNAITIAESAPNKYEINYLTSNSIYRAIADKFRFIRKDDNSMPGISKMIKPSELFKMYYLNPNEGFMVESVFNGVKTASYLYFELNNKKYRYNNRSHQLDSVTKEIIMSDLHRLLTV